MENSDTLMTGVPGLDAVLSGGIPRGALVLIVGPTGAGKTILATQIAFHHARQGRRALILTAMTEASSKLIAHLSSLAYFDTALLGEQVQIFNIQQTLQKQTLETTLDELLRLVMRQRIEILVLESVRSLYALVADQAAVQDFIFRLGSAMFQVGCTTLLVTDAQALDLSTTLEAVISDVTLTLEVTLAGKRELRELRVIKLRGAPLRTGRHSFTITSAGLQVYPRIETLAQAGELPTSDARLSWGIPRLDDLIGGGIPQYDATLVLGTSGIGKTTIGLHFVAAGVTAGEPCLYLTFHETPDQLLRKATRFGLGLAEAAAAGQLTISYIPPAEVTVDRVTTHLLQLVGAQGIRRLVIDTLNPLERHATREDRFPEVVSALVSVLQAQGVTTVLTREMTQVVGQSLDLGNGQNAYWTPIDSIILLRPVELSGAVGRVFSVLKMRNSDYDRSIYSFAIGERGLTIGEPLHGLQGLFTGLPHWATNRERQDDDD